jgi:hypothetical protein
LRSGDVQLNSRLVVLARLGRRDQAQPRASRLHARVDDAALLRRQLHAAGRYDKSGSEGAQQALKPPG